MTYQVMVADPPWSFGDKLSGKNMGGCEKHYETLSLREIEAFPLPEMQPNAVLFLWRVSAMQEEALAVMRAWGFKLKTELVWRKLSRSGEKEHFGMGRYVRAAHETCLIGVRGRCTPRVLNVHSVFSAPIGAHSAKPEAFYRLIEQLYAGPYVELFARRESARVDDVRKRARGGSAGHSR